MAADTATYAYDNLGRLKTVTYANGTIISYNYDPAGNRTASFCGMIVDDGSGPQGYGFFQLMKLPEAGPPATTLRTSPILSGNLLLQTLN